MDQYNDDLRKKRYGQYFSGNKVADLLVSLLPENAVIKTVIDPMVGCGDMLNAVSKQFTDINTLMGVDIDKEVKCLCEKRQINADIHIGDAFTSDVIIRSEGWDLVITNPPYVRYQLLNTNKEFGLPNGESIRENLKNQIKKSPILDSKERELYKSIIDNYSGLSDMAVPSWILCASLVKHDGYLAMVVPETWLNRDYALPIHYLLLKCFDILSVTKDIESVWFDNALVRTCLVVAKRKKEELIIQSMDKKTIYIELAATLIGRDSLVDNLRYGSYFGKNAFKKMLSLNYKYEDDGIVMRTVSTVSLFVKLMSSLTELPWILDEDSIEVNDSDRLPEELRTLLDINHCGYVSLEDYGWGIGQGLRTGANEFFYGFVLSHKDGMNEVLTRNWNNKKILVEEDVVRKVLQNRSDISGLVVEEGALNKCLFYIQDKIRKKDTSRLSEFSKNKYSIMTVQLENYISEAETYVNPKTNKVFPVYSAVKPNEKKDGDGYRRFWYMLPILQNRHTPNICISRLCGKSVESLYVESAKENLIVVDANFITLWNPDTKIQMITFALLNSTWFKCYMELIGTKMGGGALKLEASHIRQVLFPRLNDKQKERLYEAGKLLYYQRTMSDEIQKHIDEIIVSSYDAEIGERINRGLSDILHKKLRERGIYEF